jgi:three-Cys-motif partner protein
MSSPCAERMTLDTTSRVAFDHFYFIDLNPSKTAYLATLCKGRRDVDIVTDDATSYLTRKLLPTIQFAQYNRAMCLLDPYGLHLEWDVMLQAGQSRAVDMFLNFPVMNMNRNAIWKNPEQAPQGGIERMTRFWGDESWKQAAYAESAQYKLFPPPDRVKQGNDAIVAAFRDRLKKSCRLQGSARAASDEEQQQRCGLLFIFRITEGRCTENHRRHFWQNTGDTSP